jgi:sortase A
VAKLEARSVGLTATVIEGSSDDMLARAAGHIEDTALPGERGNVGIAGHRDTTFRPVRRLAVGDRIALTTSAGRFDYRIVRTFVVKPDAVWVLDPTPRPSLTLVTCYPFTFIGHAPMRYIVQAELQGRTGSEP